MLFFSGFALGLGLGVSCTFAFVQWKALAKQRRRQLLRSFGSFVYFGSYFCYGCSGSKVIKRINSVCRHC
jgi:hypothetical protein